MKKIDVTMVRIYLTEAESQQGTLLKRLHDWEKVRGVTVFRGTNGFGMSGKFHTSRLLDLSLDLPVVLEFFDEPGKIDAIIEHLSGFIDSGHIVSWSAKLTVED